MRLRHLAAVEGGVLSGVETAFCAKTLQNQNLMPRRLDMAMDNAGPASRGDAASLDEMLCPG